MANLAKKGVKTAESLVQDVAAVLNPDEPAGSTAGKKSPAKSTATKKTATKSTPAKSTAAKKSPA